MCSMEPLPPQKAAEMLRKNGMDVTDEQAVMILEFLRMLSAMIVSTYLEKAAIEKKDAA